MRITAIKQQVKTKARYSIFVDEKYSFSLSELELMNAGLRIGQELTKEGVANLKETSKLDKAYNMTLALIARRPRSEWEVHDYLKRKHYEQPIIEAILNRLTVNKLIDDLVFARMWVENRRLLKATSKRRLRQELRQKRVSDDHIDQVLDEDETDDREVLRELVKRKRKQPKYQDNLKLMQYLSRQGYNYDDIKSVIASDE